MNLRKKTILIIVLTFSILLTISYFHSQGILLEDYKELEKKTVSDNLERIFSVMDDQGSALENQVKDWGLWDATYDFVQGNYENYILENLPDESFVNLKINLVFFFNISGVLVYSKAYDLQQKQEEPIPQGIEEYVSTESPLLNALFTKETVTGYVLLNNTPLLISSGPIIPTSGDGIPCGVLIMGRYFDRDEIDYLNNLIKLSFNIYQWEDPKAPEDVQQAISLLSEQDSSFIQPLDDGSIVGFMPFTDIYGKKKFIIRTEMPRLIFQRGQQTIDYFFLFMIMSNGVIGLIIIILLEKTIVGRLYKLDKNIKKIILKKEFTKRIHEKERNDEISNLIHTINTLIEEKQGYEENLKKSYHTVCESNKQLKEKIDELEQYKKITVDRELRMIELKKQIADLKTDRNFGESYD